MRHNNTLYVTTPGTYVGLNHLCLEVRMEGSSKQIPLHHLGAVVLFGQQMISPMAMAACSARGISIAFITERGKFLARVEGRISGNVLLRRKHYRAADDAELQLKFARNFVLGKLVNSRTVLRRAARDRSDEHIAEAAEAISSCIKRLGDAATVDTVRGIEGEAASRYFRVMPNMITKPAMSILFKGRSRRPPKDPVNALLSFLYTLLLNDVRSALEAVGLDPQVGFLHVDRPGRPSLALDVMEEFRAPVADRLMLALMNRAQLNEKSFAIGITGGFEMSEEARKLVLVEYQQRKQEELVHPFTGEKALLALVPHIQARLLARAIRGDLESYPPMIFA